MSLSDGLCPSFIRSCVNKMLWDFDEIWLVGNVTFEHYPDTDDVLDIWGIAVTDNDSSSNSVGSDDDKYQISFIVTWEHFCLLTVH